MQIPAARESSVAKYPPHTALRERLVEQVDAYFARAGVRADGGRRLGLKSALVVAWWLASWGALVFWASTWWQAGLLVLSLGLAVAGIGFNIQHDGGHGCWGRGRRRNRLSALALDAMGGSSYFWNYKHNILHHQYPNLVGVDDDLEAGPLLRLAEEQPRRWFHRFQHWYVWLLYAFLPPKWQLWDDFRTLAAGRIGNYRVPRPRGSELAFLFAGKLAFAAWAFAIPLALHSPAAVLLAYAGCCLVTGVTLGTVFQLAHCLEEASFPRAPRAAARMERPWAEHQLATTVDFAPGNRALTWYLGGLNFQVEHHLFPRVSHVHYPRLAPIVRSVCAAHGAPYLSHRTLSGALRSHVRHIKRLGRAA